MGVSSYLDVEEAMLIMRERDRFTEDEFKEAVAALMEVILTELGAIDVLQLR